MARHTYVKYVTIDGISQATPEGAAFKDTITMDGLDVVESVLSPITGGDLKRDGPRE